MKADPEMDALDEQFLSHWHKANGKWEIERLFPELRKESMEELENRLLKGKSKQLADLIRGDWEVWGDMSPGKAPWDKGPRPYNSEGGAGGSHPVGAYMFGE